VRCAHGCCVVTTTGLFFGIGSYVYLFKVSHVEHAAATTISCRVVFGSSLFGGGRGRRDGKTMTTRLIMVINYFHSVFVPMFSPWTVASGQTPFGFFPSSAVQSPLGGTATTTTAAEERESEARDEKPWRTKRWRPYLHNIIFVRSKRTRRAYYDHLCCFYTIIGRVSEFATVEPQKHI